MDPLVPGGAARNFSQALLTLAGLYRQRKNYQEAIRALQRILAKELPTRRPTGKTILAYTLAGQRSEALNQYQHCTEIVANELGLDFHRKPLNSTSKSWPER